LVCWSVDLGIGIDLSVLPHASPNEALAQPLGASSCGCHGESRYQRRTMDPNAICWHCATLTWTRQPVDSALTFH
jgi:hypothetical protein